MSRHGSNVVHSCKMTKTGSDITSVSNSIALKNRITLCFLATYHFSRKWKLSAACAVWLYGNEAVQQRVDILERQRSIITVFTPVQGRSAATQRQLQLQEGNLVDSYSYLVVILTNLWISLFFCCCLVLVLLAIILPGKSSVLLIIVLHTELSKQS